MATHLQKLKTAIAMLEYDLNRFNSGTKGASTPTRNHLMQIIKILQEMRKEIQNMPKKERKTTKTVTIENDDIPPKPELKRQTNK